MSLGTPRRVSIVIDNYNYDRFLRQSIDSALRQTHSDVEVIVVDDGSTDGSRTILSEYGEEIVALLQENRGQAAAFNAGFEASTGEIVMFLDADDMLMPSAAVTVARLFDTDSIVKAHWCSHEIDEDGRRTGRLRPNAVLPDGDLRGRTLHLGPMAHLNPPTSGNAFARKFLRAVLPMPEPEYRICADAYLVMMASAMGSIRTASRPLASWRRHQSNGYNGTEESARARIAGDLKRYDHLSTSLALRLELLGWSVDPAVWKKRNLAYKRLDRLATAMEQIARIVPEGNTYILVEDSDWNQGHLVGREIVEGRHALRPFGEDGSWTTAPPNETSAIREIERLLEIGATHAVFAWPGLWWLEQFAALERHLETRGTRVTRTGNFVAYDLRPAAKRSRSPSPPPTSHDARRPVRSEGTGPSGRTAGPGPKRHRIVEIDLSLDALNRELAQLKKEVARREAVARVRRLVEAAVPPRARVVVVSRGDPDLVSLGDRVGWHFPQLEGNVYAGCHPASSAEAIQHLEELRSKGASHFLIPDTAAWWLEHYGEFRQHLERSYRLLAAGEHSSWIYDLEGERSPRGRRAVKSKRRPKAHLTGQRFTGSRR
jgi:glycosyltransferase involved in cell wall biosynthesis